MGWKDLMKNVTDKATSVAETAQAKFEEQKQLSAIKKEEQNKKMEEMNERVTEYEQELLQNILSGFSGAPCIEVEDNILDFTKDYFEKLLLPANSVSASKITMYPYSDKIQKKAQKALREYDDTETPVFQFEGNKGEFILMTPTKLYIAVAFPENQTFVANVAVDLQQVSQLGFVSTEEGYQVVCNGVELFSADNVSEFDRITIEEYVRRLEEKDFEITETQIDEVIKKKIGDNILRIIRQYVFDDELLIYFAWGMDNITAKDFVVCTNKQILMLDREMLGATKNVKQFYYEDITSMSTDQKTSGWLEFALTAAFKLCNITIYVSGAQEKIQTLYTYEAERVIRVYQEYRRNCRGKLENMQTVLLNTDEESGMRLKVTDSEFMKILKEGHFSEKATVLKEWKEMGYLKAQSDRYISRIKIVGDIQVKGYIIQLPVPSNKISGAGVKDYEEVLEERRKRINKPRQVIKDEYVEDDFFSIDDDDDLDFPEDWK